LAWACLECLCCSASMACCAWIAWRLLSGLLGRGAVGVAVGADSPSTPGSGACAAAEAGLRSLLRILSASVSCGGGVAVVLSRATTGDNEAGSSASAEGDGALVASARGTDGGGARDRRRTYGCTAAESRGGAAEEAIGGGARWPRERARCTRRQRAASECTRRRRALSALLRAHGREPSALLSCC